MGILFNVTFAIGTCVLLLFLLGRVKMYYRKRELSDWEIGDVVLFYKNIVIREDLTVSSAPVVGWDLKYVFVEVDNLVQRVGYTDVRLNKSAVWRRHHKSCESVMGKQPSFDPKIVFTVVNAKSVAYNGKPIELLSETECEIFLKECLAVEDYETATLIRQRLQKLRQ